MRSPVCTDRKYMICMGTDIVGVGVDSGIFRAYNQMMKNTY